MLRHALAPLRQRWLHWRNESQLRVIENLQQRLVEDPVLTVPGYPGRFVVGPRSDLLRRILMTGGYEPLLAQVCRNHVDPRRDAIDVGANIGLYTLLLADLVRGGKVLAIEPTPAALVRLRRNIALNNREQSVVVFAGAAAASATTVAISIVAGREEYSTAGALVHPSISGMAFETCSVSARTLDDLVEEYGLRPGFVKIDVEGMEHTVLAGMRRTIETYRPVILAELSDPLLTRNGSSARNVLEFLRGCGYVLTDPLAPGIAPGHRVYGDVLCVPQPVPAPGRHA